jgi:peptidoglycan/xylan/chitin deacetylase (PgdA/CDA1 family)
MRTALACMTLLLFALTAHAQGVALTFDDGLDPRSQPEAAAWNAAILKALDGADVTSMILPACRVTESAAGLELVKAWGLAGHAIGNHTWTHPNLSSASVSAQDFIADVERCDRVLNTLPGWSPRLRFPYLKEGATMEKRDALRAWMAANRYRPAPVSIDGSDWYYNTRWLTWRKEQGERDDARYRQAYLEHLWDRANFYDSLSRRVLGRSANHVLLLHTNAINAAFLGDVIAMFRARGWKIVSPEEAFGDPLYAMQPQYLPAGESILWALAKQAGVEGLRYPAEDGKYEQARLDALEAGRR